MGKSCVFAVVLAAALFSFGACTDLEDLPDRGDSSADGDSDVDTDTDTYIKYMSFDGLDMLLVVDNSVSMGEEQQILATGMFSLVNAIADPVHESPAAGDIRIAVTTTDMGLSWGGEPYEEGDGWPGTNPCSASGDNGGFQTYSSGTSIDIEEGVIECREYGSQCPTGWMCDGIGTDGIGTCQDPSGDGTYQSCPSMSGAWAYVDWENYDEELAFQAACMTQQGTYGCGWEQQLQAGAAALTRSDQAVFVRENSLLAVIIVSDEMDCSMENGPGLFATSDVQGTGDVPSRLNVACGNHQDFLYEPQHYLQAWRSLKDDTVNGVFFAAIVGVPTGSDCEGNGTQIGGCLERTEMQLEEETLENSAGVDSVYFKAACTRDEGDTQVTKALPAVRMVDVAQRFGEYGYVYSICNADWTEGMTEIGNRIIDQMSGEI